MLMSSFDVAVAGAGPAGLSLAAACAEVGMRVACVAPSPLAPWERSFAVWSAEVLSMGAAAVVEAEWPRPTVWLDDATRLDLGHSYARLDVPAMQRMLLEGCERAGVTLLSGAVAAVDHDPGGTAVHLASGAALRARVFVDATGPDSRLVARAGGGEVAFQTAYGELLDVGGASLDMALMDLRGDEGAPPSFLYALPLGGGLFFAEETVLASRPPVPPSALAARLHARLDRAGVSRRRVLARERCVIPLGVPLPRRAQRVVPFGAAASMVHPATGYQVARALALAPALARTLAASPAPEDAASAAHELLWPAQRRRAWALYAFGMEAICGFDLPRLRAFLRAFFALPDAAWLGFLRGTLTPAAIAGAMVRVLVRADPAVRADLLRLVARRHPTLTRSWLQEEPA